MAGTDPTNSPTPPADHPATQPPPRKSERPSMRPGGPASLIGTTLSGRYRIERLLGEGGMGAVYEAEHTHMRKRLAVKVLHPEMSRMPEVVARFEREAMAAAHIDHPNVATATDFGKLDDGSFFLVLEFVEGKSLRDLVALGYLELGRALHITQQIAGAIGRAHTLGIVHRDLKPENVMLIEREGDKDFVKVLDFGIAKVPVGDIGVQHAAVGPVKPALTQLGMVYGTPEYMAPEQALGQSVDPRADLYALGIMAYEMLTGVRPFDHESKVTLLGMHVTAPVPPMSKIAPKANVPAEVEAIVVRLLAKDSANRPADAKELVDAIGTAVANQVALGRLGHEHLDRAAALSTGMFGPVSMRASMPGPRGSLASASTFAPGARMRAMAAGISMKTWAIGGGALGALLFLILFVTVLTGSKDGAAVKGSGDAGVVLGKPAKPAEKPPPEPGIDEKVAAAESTIDKGDYADGIAALAELELSHMDRADIHRDLERAYAGLHNTKNAMQEAELWLKADPAAAADPKLVEDVRLAAMGKESPELALSLLETRMGSAGADVLYDLAYGGAKGAPASKARAALSNADVRAHASPPLAVMLELRATSSCAGKKAILARAGEVGDRRTVTLLKTFTSDRGCGFLGLKDCYPCMRSDGALASAIEAIENRAAVP